mmetsp:Transcript_26993/g.41406  ORF Transcript_26993/g.41406 Transcript_26993/m.41406 type:complete len:360 (-) Transcript_26993:220-1299(-)
MALKRKASPVPDDYMSALRVACAPRLELSLMPRQTASPVSVYWLRDSLALNPFSMPIQSQIAPNHALTPTLLSALLAPKIFLPQNVNLNAAALIRDALSAGVLAEELLSPHSISRSTLPPQDKPLISSKSNIPATAPAEPRSQPISTSACLSTESDDKCAFSSKTWNKTFERLKLYKEKHKNCLVPRHHRDDPKLGNWVNYQRYNRNKGCLSEERIKLLDSVGFAWSANETWDGMFEQLVKYKEKNGDCLVRQDYQENPKLGSWVMTQRRKKDTLNSERLARLNSIGFVWSVHQALWDTMFESLVGFKARNGHCRVPWSYNSDPQLGRWVYEQEKNKARISAERRIRLEAVGLFRASDK